ncbi:GNAT family N-acetyltransferase [Pseudonocardia oroxyli]|uniref:Acetyltransferase (GNAT) family protein n=1 Tax=Pseudonocardia oroxyli TaxID=366584 RepID=A0A1G7QHS3_PSEOR|nr:GNAT family N-acetyltransferase [Pseudonocardia oroxyli]SDF98015.1 Acetyltransferase (GNAT) family protein [Pseudonocardia oroxyli]
MAPEHDWSAALGERVSLRFRIGEREGRPLFSDAVGVLSDDGPGTVVVATRRGPVRVDREAVVALRVVPPAPPRRASWSAVARLENLCADAWPALVDEPLGAWRLRAAGGYTNRANSALAVGDPGLPPDVALDRVRAFAAAHGVTPRLQTPIGSPWSKAAQHGGWVLEAGHAAGAEVAVLVTDLTAGEAVGLPAEPDADWWSVGGGPAHETERRILTGGRTLGFGVERRAGRVVGAIRAAVVEDHLYLSRLETVPAARRTGVATRLTAAACAWGHAHGARWGVLQVALDNAPALAFYAREGWREHHRYHYLVEQRAG